MNRVANPVAVRIKVPFMIVCFLDINVAPKIKNITIRYSVARLDRTKRE